MADVTYYVAMPFLQDDGGSPVAGAAEECQSPTAAMRRAETMSRMAGSIGAVAFSRSGDPMIGEFGDAQLLRKFGNVPDDLSGALELPISLITQLVPPLRLAHIHRAVGLLQRAAGFGMGAENRNAGGGAGRDGAAAKHEGEAIDGLLQRGRLGLGVGLAEIPQQQRELVAAEPADHVGGAHLARAAWRRSPSAPGRPRHARRHR